MSNELPEGYKIPKKKQAKTKQIILSSDSSTDSEVENEMKEFAEKQKVPKKVLISPTKRVKNITPQASPKKSSKNNTPVRRSLLVSKPVNPHSVENTLASEINALILQTISLEDNTITNELVKVNWQVIREKLNTLMLRSINGTDLDIQSLNNLLDDVKISPGIRVIIEDTMKDRLDFLRPTLLKECHCADIALNKGKS